MTKLLLLLLCATYNCCSQSKVDFRNTALEKEVNSFIRDLKKSKLEIISIVFEATKKEDTVYISMSNAYPDIRQITSYAKYKEVYFCFVEDFRAKEYYDVVNPEPVPPHLKKAFEERRQGATSVFNEPFTKYFTFYNGKIIESVVMNKE